MKSMRGRARRVYKIIMTPTCMHRSANGGAKGGA